MVCRALLVPSAQNKRSRGAPIDNGKHLVWGREPGKKSMGTRREQDRSLQSHLLKGEVRQAHPRDSVWN
jgi:hypothetical protein